MNPYEVLGVARTATADEIKRAYRSLASQHHPDKGGDTQKFQQIQSAYDTLSDPAKRAEYDQPRASFQSFNFDFGGASPFGDVFDQMFRQHQRRSHVRMTVWISLAEVAQGGSRTVNVGTSGGTSTVQIQIPQGIEDGDNVQYGGVAPNGMDLVVQFRIHADPRWRREGLNLHTDHRVSIWDLILGSETEITTISGTKLSVKIPAGMQPGTVMRLRTHGLKNQKGAAGDLLLHLQAEIPRNIAPEIVDAIRRHR